MLFPGSKLSPPKSPEKQGTQVGLFYITENVYIKIYTVNSIPNWLLQ